MGIYNRMMISTIKCYPRNQLKPLQQKSELLNAFSGYSPYNHITFLKDYFQLSRYKDFYKLSWF